MDNELKLAYLKAACLHIEAELDRVIDYTVYEDRVAMVVNNGIKGCPKYTVPLVELDLAVGLEELVKEPMVKAEPVVSATHAARILAKKHGIDLATVMGTGRGGKVSIADVRQVQAATEEEE